MGMKPEIEMPPAIDPEIKAKETAAEEKLEKEKKKLTKLASSGNYGTIMTGGAGVTEEAETSATLLGGIS
jgi:hypothetical protein